LEIRGIKGLTPNTGPTTRKGIVDKLGEFHRNNETLTNLNGGRLGTVTRMLGRCLPLLLLLLLFACVDKAETVPYPPKAAYLPPPSYRLQAGDTLDVKFLYTPELNEEQTVQIDGHVSFQYASNLSVGGRTLPEAQDMVMAAYAKTLRDPATELTVKGPMQWRIYVVGEVTTPGEFSTLGPPLTLTQAIARAGGLKESADGDNVVLLRRDGSIERAYDVSFDDAAHHHGDLADIQLADHDVLYVPRTDVAQAGVNWRQYVMQFVPPNVSVILGSTSTAAIP
jgi:polysaccharide biosynthesis/export protein